VVDAKDGHLVGITFAYYDAPNNKGPREMLAYRIDFVMDEYRALQAKNFRNDLKDFSRDFPEK
jgi:predicted ester cyclase